MLAPILARPRLRTARCFHHLEARHPDRPEQRLRGPLPPPPPHPTPRPLSRAPSVRQPWQAALALRLAPNPSPAVTAVVPRSMARPNLYCLPVAAAVVQPRSSIRPAAAPSGAAPLGTGAWR
ncbi:hypothetical protein GCM10009853_023990 [Glycomyces scopariae]